MAFYHVQVQFLVRVRCVTSSEVNPTAVVKVKVRHDG